MNNFSSIRTNRFKTTKDKNRDDERMLLSIEYMKTLPLTKNKILEIITINNIDVLQNYKNFLIQKKIVQGTSVETCNIEIFNQNLEKAYIQDNKCFSCPDNLKELHSKLLSKNLSAYEIVLQRRNQMELLDDPQFPEADKIISEFNNNAETFFNIIKENIDNNQCPNIFRILYNQHCFQNNRSFLNFLSDKKNKTISTNFLNLRTEKFIDLIKILKYYDKFCDKSIYDIDSLPAYDLFKILKPLKDEEVNSLKYISLQEKIKKNSFLEKITDIENQLCSIDLFVLVNHIYLKNRPYKNEELIELNETYKKEEYDFLDLIDEYKNILKSYLECFEDKYYSYIYNYLDKNYITFIT